MEELKTLIDIPSFLEGTAETIGEALIDIPAYLSGDSGISTLADCGSCQSTAQSCGSSQSGSCSSCEGLGCMASNCQTACQSSCQDTCEKKAQGCSTTCEKNCQTTCEKNCQTTAENDCGDCEYYEGDCNSCMVTAEECGGAQGDCDTCQGNTQGCAQGCSESCTVSTESAGQLEDPTWTISSVTNESVTVKVTDKGDYSYFSWSLRDSSGSTIISGPTAYSASTSKTFSGLSPSTTYRIYISWSTSTTGEGNYDWDVFTTTDLEIEPWTWHGNNGNAGQSLTVDAYEAITGRGATTDFSYLVWNDLVNKVNSVKGEAGYSWNTKYLSLSATKMTSSNKILTADRFNSLRYNIGIHESTGLDDVYTGDEVFGWYFTALTNALNTWIDTLNES